LGTSARINVNIIANTDGLPEILFESSFAITVERNASAMTLLDHHSFTGHCFCSEDDCVFGNQEALKEHLRTQTHASEFRWCNCNIDFKDVHTLNTHIAVVNRPRFGCQRAGRAGRRQQGVWGTASRAYGASPTGRTGRTPCVYISPCLLDSPYRTRQLLPTTIRTLVCCAQQ
jgi:hypothetical protein